MKLFLTERETIEHMTRKHVFNFYVSKIEHWITRFGILMARRGRNSKFTLLYFYDLDHSYSSVL